MRSVFVLAALVLGALPVLASDPAPTRPPAPYLRGNQCLDPAFARGFTSLDDRRLLVDAGRQRYLVEVSPSCWNLDFASALGFRGDPISGRVCGSVRDAVLLRGEPPCKIERMQLLDKEQYDAALREREAWLQARRAERKAKRKD